MQRFSPQRCEWAGAEIASRTGYKDTMLIRTVTCFILRSNHLLLQKRPAGRPWAGILNGPGGKVDPGEEAADAIVREVLEETGLRIANPEPRGFLILQIPSPRIMEVSVDIFVAKSFEGDVLEREGTLSWHDREALPLQNMWPDQKYWLGAVLDGLSVEGSVAYEPDLLGLTLCQLRLQLPAQISPARDHWLPG